VKRYEKLLSYCIQGKVKLFPLFTESFEHNRYIFFQVFIVDKHGDSGWWKAFDGKAIGYIPKDYVTPFS